MSTGVANLYGLAGSLLQAVNVYFGEQGVPTPTTQYVNGKGVTPIAICDTMVVGWSQVYWGTPGYGEQQLPVKQQQMRSADLQVWIFRCVATLVDGAAGLTLDLAAEIADAETIMTDAYLLPKAVKVAHGDGTFEDYCSGLSIGRCVPIEPLGGIAGVQMDVFVELS
jgi:hypothetical protein